MEPAMASVYVILVNWNGYHDTIECVESLLRLNEDDFHIVIVDNGSTDHSIEKFEEWDRLGEGYEFDQPPSVWADLPSQRRHEAPLRIVGRDADPSDTHRITVVKTDENLGFAGANNLGLALAAKDDKCRWMWVLNNDTVVLPDALSALIDHGTSNGNQAIIGATLLYYHNPEIVQGLGGWIDPKKAKAGHIGAGISKNNLPERNAVEGELAYVMGASMFIRRTAYDIMGGMSEDYFLYFEELDWAERIPASLSQGWCKDAIIFHKEGGSIGTSSTEYRPSDTSLYYLRRGLLKYYWRNKKPYFPMAMGRIAMNFLNYARRGDTAAVKVIACVFVDTLKKRARRGAFGSSDFLSGLPRQR
jgi:GT2 family glycosyltransferase